MGTLLLYGLLAATSIVTLRAIWVGVVAYYVLSILYPQIIWPWIFYGIRATFIISAATVLSFIKNLVFGNIDSGIFKHRQNFYLLLIWLTIVLSYFFNPYGNNTTDIIMYNTDYLFSAFNKIFVFYFISITAIRTKTHYHAFVVILVGIVLYFVYYANMTYLQGYNGRLAGPGAGGIYSDENVFAMVFVVGFPFLYFMGNHYKNKFIKFGLWLAIPFLWHAVFLTGSLGGLIGLGVTMMFVAMRSKHKLFMVIMPIALIIAFIDQGGQYLKTKALGNEGGITEVDTAQTRFDSWTAGLRMIARHPVTGVGPGNFLKYYSDYSETRAFVAHNTFIQFAAETGLLSGLLYLLIGLGFLTTYWKTRELDKTEFDPFLLATKESLTGAIIGFYVCATFLNLATYEIYYYMLICKVIQDKLTADHINRSDYNASAGQTLTKATVH